MGAQFKRAFKFKLEEAKDSTTDSNIGIVKGYLAVFGNVDYYDDVIEPGAFKKTISENASWPFLWMHDPHNPIGRIFLLREDAHGLWMEAEVYKDIQQGREGWILLMRKAITGLSIGFDAIKWIYDETAKVRRILEIKLWEGSEVTFPANDLATVVETRGLPANHVKLLKALNRLEGVPEMLKAGFLKAGKSKERKDVDQAESLLDAALDNLMSLRTELESMEVVEDEPESDAGAEPPKGHSGQAENHSLELEMKQSLEMASKSMAALY